jgi:cyanophycinase
LRFPLFLILLLLLQVSAAGAVKRYLTGNKQDVRPGELHGPVFNIGGGGQDVDEALQWMINKVRGCESCPAKVDFVVLRASGADGYNSPVSRLSGVDSVETLVITERSDSADKSLIETIKNAEIVFFAGGNQCDYIRLFKGTEVITAIDDLYKRGGGIGGTSAGAAIMGRFIYSGCTGSTISSEALTDPFHSSISFDESLFNFDALSEIIFDTHFVERKREGRLMSFMARHLAENRACRIAGIGIEAGTSIVIDETGYFRILGRGPVHIYLADQKPLIVQKSKPVTSLGFRAITVAHHDLVNLESLSSLPFDTKHIRNGSIETEEPAKCPE